MFYTIITIALCAVGALTFIPQLKGAMERYSIGINFFLTLIATLVGVFIAISITNYEAQQKEKQDVIKLLRSAMSSIDTCHDYSEKLIDYFNKLPKHDDARPDFFSKNPPPYPEYLDTFLMQNLVSKNLSGTSLNQLNENLINLKRSRTFNAPLYLTVLDNTFKLLQLEVSYQQGHLNEVQLEAQINDLDTVLTNSPLLD
ncbi:hypothetical protein [Shewanella waksmanii]|uniref:hypothetical protein n=1 Tax=Shewanella waksmanii TaxID=213783 RepID=UPI003736C761